MHKNNVAFRCAKYLFWGRMCAVLQKWQAHFIGTVHTRFEMKMINEKDGSFFFSWPSPRTTVSRAVAPFIAADLRVFL